MMLELCSQLCYLLCTVLYITVGISRTKPSQCLVSNTFIMQLICMLGNVQRPGDSLPKFMNGLSWFLCLEYKKSRQNAKRVISSAKEKKQKEWANDLNDSESQNEIFRRAKQMAKERQDITGLNCIKRSIRESDCR